MISGWQAKIEKPGSVSVFYKFNTSDIRKSIIEIRKGDKQARFKDIKYTIFTDLAFKLARTALDDGPISSISIINTNSSGAD